MSVQEISLQRVEHTRPLISNYLLGTAGMICSPLLYFASLLSPHNPDSVNPNQVYTSTLAILYLFGAMCTLTAMRNARVTGPGTGAAILYAVQMFGLFLAMWFDVFELTALRQRGSTLFFVVDIAYPFSHIMFLITGIAIVRAGVWRGLRRVPAFLVGIALPSFLSLSALFGRENANFIFPLLVTVGFLLLGLAARKSSADKTT